MINPIDEERFYKEFLQTPRGKLIESEYDFVYCVKNVLKASADYGSDLSGQIAFWEKYGVTPRELIGNPEIVINPPKFKIPTTKFSITPFYYLNFLEEINPKTIADIGCGWNIFKKYIPNIIGFDRIGSNADIMEIYDSDFQKKYHQSFDAAFAINIKTVTWENIDKFIINFSKIIKPKGRGFLGIPALFPLLLTPKKWYDDRELSPYDPDTLSKYIDNLIESLDIKIISLESRVDFVQNMMSHDGDIRVVFEVL